MSDDIDPNAKSRAQLPILLGIVGAVAGHIGTFTLTMGANPQDPVTSGLTALFVYGPIGAVIGAFAGAKLGRLIRPKQPEAESIAAALPTGMSVAPPPAAVSAATPAAGVSRATPSTSASIATPPTGVSAPKALPKPPGGFFADTTAGNARKSLTIVFGTVAALIGGWAFIEYQFIATPWLRPDGTELPFEVRLPAGAAMPSADNVKGLLVTTVNTMPAEMKPAAFRRDGDRPVIVGVVDLAFRSGSRQLEITIPGRAVASHPIKIARSPSHMKALSAWQAHPDGSEIRYRVKHPGKD